MPKYKLMGFPADCPERTAEVFAKYDIEFDLKRNGSIWLNSSHLKRYWELKDKFNQMAYDLFGHPLKYPVIDHERYYLTNQKTYITTFSPYSSYEGDECWEKMILVAPQYGLEIIKLPRDEWFYSPACRTYLIREKAA